jgi:hypothetical protein
VRGKPATPNSPASRGRMMIGNFHYSEGDEPIMKDFSETLQGVENKLSISLDKAIAKIYLS